MRNECDVHFFSFKPEIPFLGEYAVFNGDGHFFYFYQETPFFGKFVPQNQNTS